MSFKDMDRQTLLSLYEDLSIQQREAKNNVRDIQKQMNAVKSALKTKPK